MIECIICDAKIDKPHWAGSEKEPYDLTCDTECFTILFWILQWKYDQENPLKVVIVDGNHYLIGEENDRFQGFGGSEFHIHFLNERRCVLSHNLWHQGNIPEEFKSWFLDNAVFITQQDTRFGFVREDSAWIH